MSTNPTPPTLTKPVDLPGLASNCEACADFFERYPGMTERAPGIVIDLYRNVALLARMVEDLQKHGRK